MAGRCRSWNEDCKTSLPRRFVFQSALKILDLARHDGAEFNLAGPLTGLESDPGRHPRKPSDPVRQFAPVHEKPVLAD